MHGKQGYHDFAFNVVMRERFSVITDILDLGYNVLMNDADTLWLDGKSQTQQLKFALTLVRFVARLASQSSRYCCADGSAHGEIF